VSKLTDALRAKFKHPKDALAALGLDAAALGMDAMATDPPTSEAQRRAMFAARAGHSNLGIPRSVGEEFAEADPGGKLPKRAKDAVTHDPKTGQFSGIAPGATGSPERIAHHKAGLEFHSAEATKLQGAGKRYSEHLDAHDAHKLAMYEHHGAAKGVTNPATAEQASEKARKLSSMVGRDHAITGDSKENSMTTTKLSPRALSTRGALTAYLHPRLAQDARLDLNTILAGVTAKNFAARKPFLVTALRSAAAGNLAQDADVDDVGEILDQIEELAAEAGEAVQGTSAEGEGSLEGEHEGEHEDEENGEDDGENHVAEFLKDKLSPEDLATVIKMMGHGEKESEEQSMDWEARAREAHDHLGRDETSEERDERERKQSAEDARKRLGRDESEEERRKREGEDSRRAMDRKRAHDAEEEDRPVTKEAMDAAISAAVARGTADAVANQRAIREAERFVRPWVGDLAMDAAAPADVFRAALKSLNVDGVDKLHPDALRPILTAQPRLGERAQPRLAADSLPGGVKSFAERFPAAARVEHV
jgi:hypothetical protein